MNRNDLCIVIGRFSPFHNGHYDFLKAASDKFTNVLVLVGSDRRSRNLYIPWNLEERSNMFRLAFPNLVGIEGIRDYPYPYENKKWINQVEDIVEHYSDKKTDIHIACNEAGMADGTTPYIKFFPKWKLFPVATQNSVNATVVRELYFNQTIYGHPVADRAKDMLLRNLVPDHTYWELHGFRNTYEFTELEETYHKACESRAMFGEGPHLCTDMLITCGKKVLLVTRKNIPGRGLLAMPGGYLEKGLTLEQNALKELREETGLGSAYAPKKLPAPVQYDAVHRSGNGNRNVTHVYRHKIRGSLPLVQGGDDAAKADWYDIKEVMQAPEHFHDDHFFILEDML